MFVLTSHYRHKRVLGDRCFSNINIVWESSWKKFHMTTTCSFGIEHVYEKASLWDKCTESAVVKAPQWAGTRSRGRFQPLEIQNYLVSFFLRIQAPSKDFFHEKKEKNNYALQSQRLIEWEYLHQNLSTAIYRDL